MQVIGTTFNSFAGPYRILGIYSPLANVYAGMNYAIARYGPDWRNVLGHGHGYAAGGPTTGGYAWVGERGRELMRLPAGGHIYPHGQSEAMAAGPAIKVTISLDKSMERGLGADLLRRLRYDVRTAGGGNVQAALGR
jgi:SLT domain-containing protein